MIFDYNKLTVLRLKEELRNLGLAASGSKTELIARMMEANPTGEGIIHAVVNPYVEDPVSLDSPNEAREFQDSGTSAAEREVEWLRREKNLMERELELARREVEMMRRMQNVSVAETDQTRREPATSTGRTTHLKMSVSSIADLLNYFDGNGSDYDRWERQVILLKSTYRLAENECRILIVQRLKGRASEWFHSRAEFIQMDVDQLLAELRTMFHHTPNKAARRRLFEQRSWRKGEAFSEYFHEKVILANQVPIEEDEMVDSIIDGIPDPILRNQACIQKFESKLSLLAAFQKVSLQQQTRTTDGGQEMKKFHRNEENKRSAIKTVPQNGKRYHSCGAKDHLIVNCPTKDKGVKCFGCRDFGHVSANCPKKAAKDACEVSQMTLNGKYYKGTTINGHSVKALVDTGSDLCLMRAGKYIEIGAPQLERKRIMFRGVGSANNETLGEFIAKIEIDHNLYSIRVRVVSDNLTQHDLIIGTDFLNAVDVTIREGKISIVKPKKIIETNTQTDVTDLSNILPINYEVNEIDASYVVNREHRTAIENMIRSYIPDKACDTEVKMTIIVKDEEPIYQRARRLSVSERESVNKQVEEWLRDGIIQPSLSEYASPVVLVKKKDGSNRLCVDYRKINQKILKDRYPLPLIEDQLDQLQGAKIFTTLDLKNGFFHVSVDRNSRKYTAFIVPDGQYEFLKVPFGLCNSPAVFQKFINSVFRELINNKTALTYMDDLIIPSVDCETGIVKLQTVLNTAAKFGLIINWKKCCFLQSRVEFLGHIIENGTVRPSERKTDAVMQFAKPKTTKQLQSFLGLTGYFRKFVPLYSLIARPLTNLLKSNVKFQFEEKEEAAFTRLKLLLSDKPVLRLYRVGAETELHTDASKKGYGAILLQRDTEDGALHPVFYASGKTTEAEEKYSSYELEVLAIIKSLRKFRVYLLGICFKIVTDCKAFSLTMKKADLCIRVARWVLLLEEFKYAIEHRSGKSMSHVDALSRSPLPSSLVIDESDESLTARLKKAQGEDRDLKRIMDECENQRMDGYVCRNGVLFKESRDDVRLVVPKSMQTQIIRQAHERGHFSCNKTELLVKRNYWFPNMQSKIAKAVKNCVSCILAERKQGRQEGLLHPIDKGDAPLDTLHIDHLGPIPSTKKSYRFIFVVIDAFSKFVWLYATKSTDAEEVICRLGKQAVIFGNPRRMISDRGSAFTSHAFRDYCKKENIEHVMITTGTPRGNGQVERVNRVLIPLLAKMAMPKPEEWHRYLDYAQKYLNSTHHRSIGTTPFNLLFGSHMRLKEDVSLREMIEKEWTMAFQEDREELRERAREEISKVQEENRRTYNKKRKKAAQYSENDLVAIQRTQSKPGLKVSSKFLGPYAVVKTLRNDRYIVRKVGEHEGPMETSAAADHMKPWLTNKDDVTSDEENDDEQYDDRQDGDI